MKIIGIIPARFNSTRLPGKPLLDINGKTMIERVYTQACKSSMLTRIIAATEDTRIFDHVTGFGGEAMMTSNKHNNGTERCGEVMQKIKSQFDVVLNIQGDEPFIQPEQIDQLCNCFSDPSVQIATLIKKIHKTEELFNPNILKVIKNNDNKAIYFSRAPVPYLRDVVEQKWLEHHIYYKHICFYGFRPNILAELVALSVTPLEKAESLEQLRWLENGYSINVDITNMESKSVDTIEDLETVKNKEDEA